MVTGICIKAKKYHVAVDFTKDFTKMKFGQGTALIEAKVKDVNAGEAIQTSNHDPVTYSKDGCLKQSVDCFDEYDYS